MDAIITKEGVQLERHYTFFYCSPTRSSLLSGRLPAHVSENNDYACTLEGAMPRNMTTIADKLRCVHSPCSPWLKVRTATPQRITGDLWNKVAATQRLVQQNTNLTTVYGVLHDTQVCQLWDAPDRQMAPGPKSQWIRPCQPWFCTVICLPHPASPWTNINLCSCSLERCGFFHHSSI